MSRCAVASCPNKASKSRYGKVEISLCGKHEKALEKSIRSASEEMTQMGFPDAYEMMALIETQALLYPGDSPRMIVYEGGQSANPDSQRKRAS